MGGVTTKVHTFTVPLPDLTGVPAEALCAAAAVAWYMAAAVAVTRPRVTAFLLRLAGDPAADPGDRQFIQVLAWAFSPLAFPGYVLYRAALALGQAAAWALSLGLLVRAPWAADPKAPAAAAPAVPTAQADQPGAVSSDELARFKRLRLWRPTDTPDDDKPDCWLWVDAWAVDAAYTETDGTTTLLVCGVVRRVYGADPRRVLGYLYGRYPDPGYPLPADTRSI